MKLIPLRIQENRFKISRTLLQLEFILFMDVGPKEKDLSFFGVWGERKTGMSDELRQSSTSEIIFKLPIYHPPQKNNTPSKQN